MHTRFLLGLVLLLDVSLLANSLVRNPPPPPIIRQEAAPADLTFSQELGGRPKSMGDLLERYGLNVKLKSPLHESEEQGASPTFLKAALNLDVKDLKASVDFKFGFGRPGKEAQSFSLKAATDGEKYEATVGGGVDVGGWGGEGKVTTGTDRTPFYAVGVKKDFVKFSRKVEEDKTTNTVEFDTPFFSVEVDPVKAGERYKKFYSALGRAAGRKMGTILNIDPKRKTIQATNDPKVGGVMVKFSLDGLNDEISDEDFARLDAELQSLLLGESKGFVFQFGRCEEESFTKMSLKDWLASGERNLGQMTRVRGYVLFEDDIVLVGQIEEGMPVVDGDFLTVALDTVYTKGMSPFVSLDPNPLDFSGEQYARVGGVPDEYMKSEFVKVMLDADYDMKKIMLGEMDSGVRDLETVYELISRNPSDIDESSHRFWLTPMTNLVGDIRVCNQVVLYYSSVEILTERDKLIGECLVPTGETGDLERRASFSMTQNYAAIEKQHKSFYRLHQIFDVSKLAAILRYRKVQHPLIEAIAVREIQKVEVPRSYPGVGPKIVSGTQVFVTGGAKARQGLSKYRFLETDNLNGLAGNSGRIPCQQIGHLQEQAAPELLVHEAIEDFSGGDTAACVEKIERALESDPELTEGYAYRGLARYELGDIQGALQDLDFAVSSTPILKVTRAMVRLAAGDEQGARRDMKEVVAELPEEPAVWKASAVLNLHLMDFTTARKHASHAMEMSPLDFEALGIHAVIDDLQKMGLEKAAKRLKEQRALPVPLMLAMQRGLSASSAGQSEEARIQYRKALNLVEHRYAEHPAVLAQQIRERLWMVLAVSYVSGKDKDAQPMVRILDLALSPDGRHIAFVGMKGEDSILVVDGREEALPGRFRGRPDKAQADEPWNAVAAIEQGNEPSTNWVEFVASDLSGLVVHDSGKVACVIEIESESFVLVNGKVLGPFQVILDSPRFTVGGDGIELPLGEGSEILWRTYRLNAGDAPDFKDRRIGKVPAGMSVEFVDLSADGDRFVVTGAIRDGENRKHLVCPDGDIDTAITVSSDLRFEAPHPRMSPMTHRLACVVEKDGRFAVKFGQELGPEYARIHRATSFVFSRDGTKLAYIGGKQRRPETNDEPYEPIKWFLNFDGGEIEVPEPEGPLVVSPDGEHVAYPSRNKVILDGQPVSGLARGHSLAFAPDGKLVFVEIDSESPTEKETKRKIGSLLRAIHGGLISGLPGAADEIFRDFCRQVSDKLPGPQARLFFDRKTTARHQDIRLPTFNADGSVSAYAAQVGAGWHVFVDGKPILLHPAFRYADLLIATRPEWPTGYVIKGLVATIQGYHSPVDATDILDAGFNMAGDADPLYEDMTRRMGGQQVRDAMYCIGATMGALGEGNPRPYLKRLEASPGLPGDFARTYVGMIHPKLPNKEALRKLADRALNRPVEEPADVLVFSVLVHQVSEMELKSAGDPARALRMIAALHDKLPAKSNSPMIMKLSSTFRSLSLADVAKCYQHIALGDPALGKLVKEIPVDEFQLNTIFDQVDFSLQRARKASSRAFSPFVESLIETQLEGLFMNLSREVLERMIRDARQGEPPISKDKMDELRTALSDIDTKGRKDRFDRVYQSLLEAVDQASTLSDVSTLDHYVSAQENFSNVFPTDGNMQDVVNAVTRLQGIRARLRMKRLASIVQPVAVRSR